MILIGDEDAGHRIAERSGANFNPRCDVVIARYEGDELLGGGIYQNYTGRSVAMHVAGFRTDWLNKDLLWVAFHYPFVQLGCAKIFGQVQASNQAALEFDLKLGFKEVARISDVFPDGDLIVVAMSHDECRWLKIRPTGLTTGKEAI